jgi:SAM-dependent methyltransferase
MSGREADGVDLAADQRRRWQATYQAHPGMYGGEPSAAAVRAATGFTERRASRVLELGAGHGRDTLFFARSGLVVDAVDFSATALAQLADATFDGVYAHMLLCMALPTSQIHALVGEVRRVLRPGGMFAYTVRHTGDAHYGTGTRRGDDIYEHGGFAVHFFSRSLVDALAEGWQLWEIHPFEEGALPRRLWHVTQTVPGPEHQDSPAEGRKP